MSSNNNVLKFPIQGTEDPLDNEVQTVFVDFSGVDPEVMDKIFDVMNFLSENQVELIENFKPDAQDFIEKYEQASDTAFKSNYDEAFNTLILEKIREEVNSNFDYTPEELAILTDMDFIDIITDGEFFDKSNYMENVV